MSTTQSFSEPVVPFVETQTIAEFLAQEQAKDILRFSTAGSVDDGKSTLIGRLLFDSRNVYEDHVRAVTRHDAVHGANFVDFAQLTDGLRAEREQGITIDVAYRYFSTARRKFIIADTPGHEQYTRNMATGASTSDLAIILVDARKGVLTQSRRHLYIAALLGIPHVVAAVNKMDLVGFSKAVFDAHEAELKRVAGELGIRDLLSIPVSALFGDNVVEPSTSMSWYDGPTLLEHLETVQLAIADASKGLRMAVQRVIRPHQNYRGFAGQIAAGTVRPGDAIVALPSGRTSRVRSITTFDGDLASATAPLSVALTLEDELDISRGDLIASVATQPTLSSRFEASLLWMDSRPFQEGKHYLLKHTTQTVAATAIKIRHLVNIESYAEEAAREFEMNDTGSVEIETARAIVADPYDENRVMGSFILIDPDWNTSVAAGMIRKLHAVSASDVRTRSVVVELGDRAGLAERLELELSARGHLVLRSRANSEELLRRVSDRGLIVLHESAETRELRIVSDGSKALLDEDSDDALLEAIEEETR